ncbi:hypothetical protein FA15DRAFT_674450 [Coprinopsis marcescibilis]|uniref:Pinin/SDK/MemA protein domain-containing protein n=1 Tax=Coprinopsis marcescibilis TaxID=230819 RepID=A0A5C3KHC6_COPMA|nr:hypothetical protein FA15DRAFT_674450 [Coprinopsis marcescibilis]
MATEESIEVETKTQASDVPTTPTEQTPQASGERRRPRLNLGAALGGGERRRGKGMLALALGTLNKAKIEDKERNASEAAKKRQLIEKRLQLKLRKETDSVRRAEEAKKDKSLANRKEEDLQLKDSIYKLRRKRLPLLANFLLTSDIIPSDDASLPESTNPLAPPPRSHPPPLYYLPAKLTPAQEAFLSKRKAEVNEAAAKEWEAFQQEREAGVAEVAQLRQKVVDEEARQKAERESSAMDMDTPIEEQPTSQGDSVPSSRPQGDMEVDDGPPKPSESAPNTEPEKKDESTPMQADDEDAVEY